MIILAPDEMFLKNPRQTFVGDALKLFMRWVPMVWESPSFLRSNLIYLVF